MDQKNESPRHLSVKMKSFTSLTMAITNNCLHSPTILNSEDFPNMFHYFAFLCGIPVFPPRQNHWTPITITGWQLLDWLAGFQTAWAAYHWVLRGKRLSWIRKACHYCRTVERKDCEWKSRTTQGRPSRICFSKIISKCKMWIIIPYF